MTEGAFLGRWEGPAGRRAIEQLLTRKLSLRRAELELGLTAWEVAILRRVLRHLRGRVISKPERVREARSFARKLEAMHRSRLPPEARFVERLQGPSFRGNRAHLRLLLDAIATRSEDNAWNRWRRSNGRVTPNLRAADLSELDLREVNLASADLRGAELSATVARVGRFRGADLREAVLRHADLSYADLAGVDLRGADLDHTMLTQANLDGADLRRARLVGTVLNGAILTGRASLRNAFVWGISAWNIERGKFTDERELIVAPDVTPGDIDFKIASRRDRSLRVDGLEVAHLLALLSTTGDVGRLINAAAGQLVLLLGRFTDREKATLDALESALPRFGFIPIVFQFPEPDDRDTIETVAILAGLSSFVIANISQPRSTPLEANLIIPTIAVPFVPIIRSGERPFSMFTALRRKYSWVLPLVTYRTPKGLVRQLEATVVNPAKVAAARLRRMKHPTTRY